MKVLPRNHARNRPLIWITLIALLIGLMPVTINRVAAQTSGLDEVNAQRATVSITQMTRTASGTPVISCVGSGTLVSADGLILTNAHIARGSDRCKTDMLVISLIARPGDAPIPTYYADVVQVNLGWDLAVLQINRALDGRAINKATLSLPFVELGSSEDLILDETLTFLGYPGNDEKEKNNGAVSIRRGSLINFLDESRVGARAWLKTNAAIPGRMSGGGAYNNTGKLIGIPTIERSQESRASCRLVQDTNGDGRVDNNDTCIPSGGFVDSLRPVKLARGLVRAAQLGLKLGGSSETVPLSAPTGAATFSRLFYAPGVNASGMPTSVITRAPNGTKSLYLFFDYKNMREDTVYEVRTTLDGVPNTLFSLTPSLWSGGSQGLWYIGGQEQVLANGEYVFTLLINGTRSASATITVGGIAREAPIFSDILFGVPVAGRTPDLTTTALSGTVLSPRDTITAEFIYRNLPAGTTWRQVWYNEGTPLSLNTAPVEWKTPGSGTFKISARDQEGRSLAKGRYRLELYLNEQLAATSDFVVAGRADSIRPLIFDSFAFSAELPVIAQVSEKDAVTNQTVSMGKVINANVAYPNTIQRLYAAFHWTNIETGTPWTWRLTVDGSPLFEGTQGWQGDPKSSFFWLRLDAADKFTDGLYALEVYVEGVLMGKTSVKIGIGQLPIEIFSKASGVQIQGRIVDAETGKGVAGVMVIVIKGTVLTREFTWDKAEVVELAISDSQGQFQLNRLLPRNQTYNMLVVAQGYLPMSADGVKLDNATKNPFVLKIELNRD